MNRSQETKNPVWLSPEFLEWYNCSGGGTEPHVSLRLRAYEIWNHAKKVLEHASTELELVDVITSLKRAIDHRLRALDEIYSFRSIPITSKPTQLLGILELFEIIRPLMFHNLVEIRNAVEHEDALPPDKKSCQVFLEFAWYFFRSTDRMLQIVSNEIHFYTSRLQNSHWMELKYGPDKDWNPSIRGWIPPHMFSTVFNGNWMAVLCDKIETYGELTERETQGNNQVWNPHEGLSAEDIYVHGRIRGPEAVIVSITKVYFVSV